MDPCLVISPHFDDAVLSAGQFLAGYPGAMVVTVFGGAPPGDVLTTYDASCGFRSALQAVAARQAEDRKALHDLGAVGRTLRFLDGQYEPGREPSALAAGISGELVKLLIETGATRLVAPLGLAHPDHRAVAEACRRALLWRPVVEGFAYEELPARILWPDEVEPALALWRQEFTPSPSFIGTGPLGQKERAVKRYRSQLGALEAAGAVDLHAMLVPERFYRMTPCA